MFPMSCYDGGVWVRLCRYTELDLCCGSCGGDGGAVADLPQAGHEPQLHHHHGRHHRHWHQPHQGLHITGTRIKISK